jgi:hypothetical protein
MPIDTYNPPPPHSDLNKFNHVSIFCWDFCFLPRQAQERGWKVRSPSWLHLHGQQGTLVFEVDGEGGYVPYSSHDQTAPLLVHGFAETSVGFTKTGSGQKTFKFSFSMDARVCATHVCVWAIWNCRVVGLRISAGRVRSLWFGRLPAGVLAAVGAPPSSVTRAAL